MLNISPFSHRWLPLNQVQLLVTIWANVCYVDLAMSLVSLWFHPYTLFFTFLFFYFPLNLACLTQDELPWHWYNQVFLNYHPCPYAQHMSIFACWSLSHRSLQSYLVQDWFTGCSCNILRNSKRVCQPIPMKVLFLAIWGRQIKFSF